MVDHDLIIAKAGLVQKHINRIRSRGGKDMKSFLTEIFQKLDLRDS